MNEVDKPAIRYLQEQMDDLQKELNKANTKHNTLVQFLLNMGESRLDKLFEEGQV